MTKRALFCFNTARFAAHHRLDLLRASQRQGLEIHVACPEGKETEILISEGFTVHTLNLSRKGINPLREILTLFQLNKIVRKIRPHIFQAFTIKPVIYGAVVCKFHKNVQAFLTVTGLGSAAIAKSPSKRLLWWLIRQLYKWSLSASQSTLVFQNDTDQKLFTQFKLIAPARTKIIPGTGVNIKLFSTNLPPFSSPTIIYAGRIIKDKGLVELVCACKKLANENIEFNLLIYGELDLGNPSHFTSKEWQELCQLSFVDCKGFQRDLTQVLARARIACLPSYREGFPLFLLEAGAAGLPSVSTDVPGCNALVTDQYNGLLVPAQDTNALYAALKLLLKDSKLAQKLGENAKNHVAKYYDQQHIIAEYLELYSQEEQSKAA